MNDKNVISSGRRIIQAVLSMLVAVVAFSALSSAASAATTWTVCASGCDYTTIQAAVNAVTTISGDTIDVKAGTYSVSGANINKSLTFVGAEQGVDPRPGRPGPETIIAGSGFGTFHLSAANITFDGFKFSNLKGRELDSTTNADNFAMRNCILEGSSIDPGYNTGAIQFGGGLSLHANGLVFEQNLVTADNGQLFYMGHSMDNGMVRNNIFHGDTVSFGPFGNRTGWLIEGNDFNGDVPGHGPYWGFGFNANLGDVVIRNNNVHQMSVGIGQVSVVGGSITGNTFEDNSFAAFQLWGGEFGSVVSTNVLIEHNLIKYNGTACTGFADASHGIRLRVGGDATTIHLHKDSFVDLGVGTCSQAWAIRQNDTGAADATLNWWDTTNSGVITTKFGQGAVNFMPFISAYVDDPAHSGQLGFWPLVTTSTTIDSDTPDPSIAGSAYTVSGTVEVTGLLGVTANMPTQPGQVVVSDGTDSCTDTSLTDSGTLNRYAFSCTLTSTTSGSKTLTATYTDTSADPFYNTSSGNTPHSVQLASRLAKQDVLNQMTALRATVTDKEDGKKLDEAIKHLTKSLDPSLWIDDTHPQPKGGEKVFNEEKDAVVQLRNLMKDKHSTIPDATLQGYIDQIVGADRLIAQTAINDAIGRGGDPNKIAKANDELAKGDTDAGNNKPDSAIDHYRNAWQQALKA